MNELTQRKLRQRGFTLVELMIVVAIIGILASIAIPQYQIFAARAKWGAAMSEVMAVKVAVETLLNEGQVPTLARVGMRPLTENCSTVVTGSTTAENVFVCTIIGGPSGVNGETITLTRSVANPPVWSCATSALQKFAGSPNHCAGT